MAVAPKKKKVIPKKKPTKPKKVMTGGTNGDKKKVVAKKKPTKTMTGGTNGDKKKKGTKAKVTSTAAQRNKIRRKEYLDKAYSSGIDTTNVRKSKKRGRIGEVGSSKKMVGSRNKPTIRAHYKNTKGGVTRTSDKSPLHRQVSRGYKIEKEKGKKR